MKIDPILIDPEELYLNLFKTLAQSGYSLGSIKQISNGILLLLAKSASSTEDIPKRLDDWCNQVIKSCTTNNEQEIARIVAEIMTFEDGRY